MKICHVTSVHPRHDIRIFEKECVSLAEAGYEVYLVVNDKMTDEITKGVHIISTGHDSTGRIERIFKSVNYVLEKALEVDAEIYHLHDPELFQIVDKLLGAGKKVIFDAHEDTETQILDKTWIPTVLRVPIAKLYGKYASRKMRKLSGVITVTPSFVDKYSKINDNTVMVTNYPWLRSDNVEKSDSAVHEDHEIGKHEDYVFFAGGISPQWCHKKIAEATCKLENMNYYFAGRGEDEYIADICSLGKHVRYLGVLQHAEVMNYYKGACIGMAVLNCTQVGNDGTLGNTKLFEVMRAGKPVICSDLKIWREIVEGYKCGKCVNSEDEDAIADAIRYIVNHPDEAETMGKNGKRAVEEKFNWEMQAKILIEFYGRIVDGFQNC